MKLYYYNSTRLILCELTYHRCQLVQVDNDWWEFLTNDSRMCFVALDCTVKFVKNAFLGDDLNVGCCCDSKAKKEKKVCYYLFSFSFFSFCIIVNKNWVKRVLHANCVTERHNSSCARNRFVYVNIFK